MADAAVDAELSNLCLALLVKSQEAINASLWSQDAGFFRAWWDEDAAPVDALHVDALYGQLWAHRLGLAPVIGHAEAASHLGREAKLGASTDGGGLLVMFNYSGRGERDAVRDNHVSTRAWRVRHAQMVLTERRMLKGGCSAGVGGRFARLDGPHPLGGHHPVGRLHGADGWGHYQVQGLVPRLLGLERHLRRARHQRVGCLPRRTGQGGDGGWLPMVQQPLHQVNPA